MEYGITDIASRNLYGRLYLHYDQAGLTRMPLYAMTGQVRETERRLCTDYKTESDWPGTEAGRLALLETEAFASETRYDALGRVSLRVVPDNPGGTGSRIRPTYHSTGLLDKLYVHLKGESTERTFVDGIRYNARGQRERVDYGNGVHTTYSYEPTTFRLTGLVTTRESDSKVLQDISYVYDPVGNIVKVTDGSHDCVFANNQQVNAACGYTYDAMYRLTAAAGREHVSLAQNADTDATAFLRSAWAHLNNSQQLVNYTENYVYDTAGNLTQIQHAGASTYTRYIDIDTASNRGLQRPDQGSPDFTNSFDANGNQVLMGHVDSLAWDYQDRLQKVVLVPREDDQDDAEWYVYDGAGQRVRKVRETVGYGGDVVTIEEKIYLGDAEIKRVYQTTYDEYDVPTTTKVLDRTSVHVMDDKSRVALVHYWSVDDGETEVDQNQLNTHRIRYQYGNHLGSASLELDDAGSIISYEEYLPYGGTSFVAGTSQTEVRLKEYRYSAKERDNSTGFYYYGARYYAPWVGRWVSTDPLGLKAGINDYAFVRGNPITRIDVDGRQEQPDVQQSSPEPSLIDWDNVPLIGISEQMDSCSERQPQSAPTAKNLEQFENEKMFSVPKPRDGNESDAEVVALILQFETRALETEILPFEAQKPGWTENLSRVDELKRSATTAAEYAQAARRNDPTNQNLANAEHFLYARESVIHGMPVPAEKFKIEAWGELKRQSEQVSARPYPWPRLTPRSEFVNLVPPLAYFIMKAFESLVHSKGSSFDSPDQRYWGKQGAEHGAMDLRLLKKDE